MGLFSESDDLEDTYRRLHKQEKELDRKEDKENAKRAGRKYLPAEPVGTKHACSFGWRKHPEDLQDVWTGHRLFKHVQIKHDDWGDVVGQGEEHLVMEVDREGHDLYALRLKKIGEDIGEEQASWKLQSEAAVRVGREEHGEKLGASGLSKPLLFKNLIHCELEGEWIAELALQKISDKDWFFLLTGELCEDRWTTEQRMRAEVLGRHWFYDGRFRDIPPPPPAPLPTTAYPSKHQRSKPKPGADVLAPQNKRNRISKSKAPAGATNRLSTVARMGGAMERSMRLDDDPTTSNHGANTHSVSTAPQPAAPARQGLLARATSGLPSLKRLPRFGFGRKR